MTGESFFLWAVFAIVVMFVLCLPRDDDFPRY